MRYYLPSAIAFIVLSSVLLGWILHRKKLFSIRILTAIAVSSIVVSVLFPFVYNAVSSINVYLINGFGVFLAFAITFIVYLFMVMIMSIMVSSLFSAAAEKSKKSPAKAPAPKNTAKSNNADENTAAKQINDSHEVLPTDANMPQNITKSAVDGLINKENHVDSTQNIDKMGIEQIENSQSHLQEAKVDSERNSPDYYVQEAAKSDISQEGLPSEYEVTSLQGENIEDLSDKIIVSQEDELADSEARSIVQASFAEGENTGINGSEMQAAPAVDISMSLDEYISEAFRLKENGDLEGAILYFMYALDKNPDDQLAFLIVLDICSLYKELGQIDHAKELLSNYIGDSGEYMDDSARYEIEKNLLSV